MDYIWIHNSNSFLCFTTLQKHLASKEFGIFEITFVTNKIYKLLTWVFYFSKYNYTAANLRF